MSQLRVATLERKTKETEIKLELDLDGSGKSQIDTGVPFMDHMLSHVAMQSLFDLAITCQGDTEIDDHHSIEDIGIVLGSALKTALGSKAGIQRYGQMLMPMDEALVMVALDFSGRGMLTFNAAMPSTRVGTFDTELTQEFLQSLAVNAGLTLHVRLITGSNAHHIIEAIFKGLGRALGSAAARDPRRSGVASTKGVL